MSKESVEALAINGEGMSIGIVAARFNMGYVNGLLESVLDTLKRAGVDDELIDVFRVPGSNEIPHALGHLVRIGNYDALIALGVVIEGETPHADVIAQSTGTAIQQLAIEHPVPIINGIIVGRNEEQVAARTTGELDRGREFAAAALEMGHLVATFMDMDLADLDHDLDEFLDLMDEDDDEDNWKK